MCYTLIAICPFSGNRKHGHNDYHVNPNTEASNLGLKTLCIVKLRYTRVVLPRGPGNANSSL